MMAVRSARYVDSDELRCLFLEFEGLFDGASALRPIIDAAPRLDTVFPSDNPQCIQR